MNHPQAISIAIAFIEREIKELAVKANLHDIAHANSPACVEASKRRKELREAIETLKQPHQARLL